MYYLTCEQQLFLFSVVQSSMFAPLGGKMISLRIWRIEFLGWWLLSFKPPPHLPAMSCFPKQWSGMHRVVWGGGQPGRQQGAQAAPVTVPGWPFTPQLSGLLLLRSKMFQYVELWGRDRREKSEYCWKEIMNNPAASPHTPHVGRSG
jgi:hypothetical protein